MKPPVCELCGKQGTTTAPASHRNVVVCDKHHQMYATEAVAYYNGERKTRPFYARLGTLGIHNRRHR